MSPASGLFGPLGAHELCSVQIPRVFSYGKWGMFGNFHLG